MDTPPPFRKVRLQEQLGENEALPVFRWSSSTHQSKVKIQSSWSETETKRLVKQDNQLLGNRNSFTVPLSLTIDAEPRRLRQAPPTETCCPSRLREGGREGGLREAGGDEHMNSPQEGGEDRKEKDLSSVIRILHTPGRGTQAARGERPGLVLHC